MAILGSRNLAVQTNQPAGFMCRTGRCEVSVADSFANLANWFQHYIVGTTDWDISVAHARFVGPEAGGNASTYLANAALMCSSNHSGEIDILTKPTIAAGVSDQIYVLCRLNQANPVFTTGYAGRWTQTDTPAGTYKIEIIELGVGVIATAATAITDPDHIKFTVDGTSLTVRVEDGVLNDELNTTDASITSGFYVSLRAHIGKGARAAGSELWLVDNHLQAA